MLCPAEIPEGAAVGLIKNLALMAHISIGSQPYQMIEFLEKWSMENLEEIVPNCITNSTKIFVNGSVNNSRYQRARIEDLHRWGRISKPLLVEVENQTLLLKKKRIDMLEERKNDRNRWWELIAGN
ncbi:hypothetical protein HN011_005522 [Eciton burchellii]|nr:hypothetical protein HN011_005522 [Eciton burchellii]